MTAKQRILDTSRELFYKRGVNSTGIDLIIAEAGIAKATLYNNFGSKEELVAKYLESLRLDFERSLEQAISNRGRTLAIPFDLLEESVISGDFYGCPFTNALTEMPESALVKSEVSRYREVVQSYFASLGADPSLLPQLMLVYDGAFTSCKLDPDRKRVMIARNLAQRLFELFND